MEFDNPTPEVEADPVENLVETRETKFEPWWLLIFGILLFAGFIYITWDRSETANKNGVATEMMSVKAATYLIIYERFQQLTNPDFAGQVAPGFDKKENIIKTAQSWQEASTSYPTVEGKALVLVNAATLYGAAQQTDKAVTLLEQAEHIDVAHEQSFRQLIALYRIPAHQQTLTPQTNALLKRISTGPLLRARNAQLAGDNSAEIDALRPVVAIAQRLIIIGMLAIGIIITIVVLSIVLGLSYLQQIISVFSNIAGKWEVALPWGPGGALLAIIGVFSLAWLIGDYKNSFNMPEAESLLLSAVIEVLALLIIMFTVLWVSGRRSGDWGIFGWRATPRHAGIGISMLILMLPAVWLISFLWSLVLNHKVDQHPLIPMLQSSTSIWTTLALIILAVVMAPLVEETIFRGMLFRALNVRLPFWAAALLSAFAFSIGHTQLSALPSIVVIGFLFAFLYKWTGNIWTSIAAHATFNAFGIVMALLINWSITIGSL